jgi:hypothetical protein
MEMQEELLPHPENVQNRAGLLAFSIQFASQKVKNLF